jgi:hypothetical protein
MAFSFSISAKVGHFDVDVWSARHLSQKSRWPSHSDHIDRIRLRDHVSAATNMDIVTTAQRGVVRITPDTLPAFELTRSRDGALGIGFLERTNTAPRNRGATTSSE